MLLAIELFFLGLLAAVLTGAAWVGIAVIAKLFRGQH